MTEIKFYEYPEFSEWKVKNNYSEIFYNPEQKLLSSKCCTTRFYIRKVTDNTYARVVWFVDPTNDDIIEIVVREGFKRSESVQWTKETLHKYE